MLTAEVTALGFMVLVSASTDYWYKWEHYSNNLGNISVFWGSQVLIGCYQRRFLSFTAGFLVAITHLVSVFPEGYVKNVQEIKQASNDCQNASTFW